MKSLLLVLSFVVALPLAGFAQANRGPTALTTPPPNSNETPGAATGLVTAVSGETITVKTEAANPISFAINKTVHFTDKRGRRVKPDRIKAGARVRVLFKGNEDNRTATRVIVDP
jgi:hypothetical protein